MLSRIISNSLKKNNTTTFFHFPFQQNIFLKRTLNFLLANFLNEICFVVLSFWSFPNVCLMTMHLYLRACRSTHLSLNSKNNTVLFIITCYISESVWMYVYPMRNHRRRRQFKHTGRIQIGSIWNCITLLWWNLYCTVLKIFIKQSL